MLSLFRKRSNVIRPQDMSMEVATKQNLTFVGVNAFDKTPIQFDRGESSHSFFCGPTGSGKSSTMALLLEQAVRQGRNVLLIDMKGLDNMFLGTLIDSARQCGIDEPKYLTDNFGQATHLIPFMRSEAWMHGLDPKAKADVLTAALSISDPMAHSWWSDAVEALYLFILENSEPTEIDDFAKFSAMIERRRGDLPKALRDASLHGWLKMQRLARVTMFNPPANCHPAALEHALDFKQFYCGDKQILVFVALDSLRTPKTAEAIVGLICRHLLNTAAQLGSQRKRPLEVIIDEAQRTIRGNAFLDEMLSLSRSAGISFTAAFQDLESLKHRGVDYASKFEENCHVHFTFGAHSPDAIQRQVVLSGEYEKIKRTLTYTYPGLISWRSWSESFCAQTESRFGANDVMAVSADPERFIFRLTKNTNNCALDGLPVIAQVVRHITKQQYDDRCNTEWPAPNERTVVCGSPPKEGPPQLPANPPVPPTGIPPTSAEPKILRPTQHRK